MSLFERSLPAGAVLVCEFEVLGEPKPAGSKSSGVVTRKDEATGKRVPVKREGGGWMTFTKDSTGDAGKNWRSDVRDACADALQGAHDLLDGPLAAEMLFRVERSKSHFGTGRNVGVLKDSAPALPHATKLADGTKLARAVEDALTKVLWVDDRRLVRFAWARDFGRPGATVRVWRLPTTVAEARAASAHDGQLPFAGSDGAESDARAA